MNADSFSVFAEALKGDDAVNLGENCIVSSQTYIFTGVNVGPPLPDNDASGIHFLPGITFDTPPLAVAVPSVSGTAARFLV